MDTTDGLRRGAAARDTGAPITVPVGPATLGRLFNVLGTPLDKRGDVSTRAHAPIHRKPPSFEEQETQVAGARDRHQGHRPDRAARPWW